MLWETLSERRMGMPWGPQRVMRWVLSWVMQLVTQANHLASLHVHAHVDDGALDLSEEVVELHEQKTERLLVDENIELVRSHLQ